MMDLLFSIPKETWPFSWKGQDSNNWKCGYFWWRQLWHFTGGALIGGFVRLLGLIGPGVFLAATTIASALLAGAIVWLEMRQQKDSQPKEKTWIDSMMWFGAFVFVVIL